LTGSLSSPGTAVLTLVDSEIRFPCGSIIYPATPDGKSLENASAAHVSCGRPANEDALQRLRDRDLWGTRAVDRLPSLMRDAWPDPSTPRQGLTFQQSLEVLTADRRAWSKVLLPLGSTGSRANRAPERVFPGLLLGLSRQSQLRR